MSPVTTLQHYSTTIIATATTSIMIWNINTINSIKTSKKIEIQMQIQIPLHAHNERHYDSGRNCDQIVIVNVIDHNGIGLTIGIDISIATMTIMSIIGFGL